MDLNFKEEKLFNECIDQNVKGDPKGYCTKVITDVTELEMWNQNDINELCSAGA